MIKHRHHIIPKHIGGTDDPENIVLLTIEEHAEAHRKLWEEHGRWQDEVAWRALSGQITHAEAIILAVKRANTGRKHTDESRARMSASRRGKKLPPRNETWRIRQRNSHKGRRYGKQKNPCEKRPPFTPKRKEHISKVLTGRKRGSWWNDGNRNTIAIDSPGPQWIRGRK